MERRKLIKHRLLTCSVMTVMMIISRLFIFSTILSKTAIKISSLKAKTPSKNAAPPRLPETDYYDGKHIATGLLVHEKAAKQLNFANETLPLNSKTITCRMKRSLRLHSFAHVQTNELHQKAEKMFPVIEPILKANGIPDDFKYVPLVESGFGEGRSPKGAYGAWQFMPSTARSYGLKVNSRHDDRLNLRKATIAACRYLLELHSEFKSWAMVAAAYNMGSIKLAHKVQAQSKHNYFRIQLNAETGAYVYNLIAMKQVISHPKQYGYTYRKPVYTGNAMFGGELLAFN